MEELTLISEKELGLLKAFEEFEVQYMVVGLSAAALQGAQVVTQDIDLWIRDLQSEKFREALKSVNSTFVPSFGLNPPMLAGKGLELFDLVLHMSGLGDFDQEKENVIMTEIAGVKLPVLSIERILTSKRAANRSKDRLVLTILEDTIKTKQLS